MSERPLCADIVAKFQKAQRRISAKERNKRQSPINQSLYPLVGEFESLAKRLLQQYSPETVIQTDKLSTICLSVDELTLFDGKPLSGCELTAISSRLPETADS